MRPYGSPAQLEQRRFKAVELLKEGLFPGEISKRVGVDRRSVRRWKADYILKGESAIKAIPASGRPAKLNKRKKNRLEQILLQGAQKHGYSTDLWTCPRVTQVIHRVFKINYHPAHIGRVLHNMGWSPQKPERRAKERDEKAIAKWVKFDWNSIKKKPKN